MGIVVNVTNGEITGGELTYGCSFEWGNPTDVVVNLSACGNWCNSDTYTIQPNSTTSASVLSNPNTSPFAFLDSGWDAPGMPRIVVNPTPSPKSKEAA